MTNCDIVRDLLPLYADDVCSGESRRVVDEHLKECPACADMLKALRTSEIEAGLREEKNEVIRYQAKRFKRRSEAVGAAIAGVFAVPILVCLIVNLCSGAPMGWFYVVLAAMAVAASLIIVPLMVPRDRLFWTFCAFCISLQVLLAVSCLYTHGNWYFAASSASIFGLSVAFLPFVLRAKPIQKWVGGCNRVLLALAVDLILFANMMNMISLHSKSLFTTLRMTAVCAAAAVLVGLIVKSKGGSRK